MRRAAITIIPSGVGIILGVSSLLPVIVSIIFFLTERGPNADIYLVITVFSILSIIGIILSIVSTVLSKRRKSGVIFGLIGLTGNLAVLIFAFLLIIAMGIGEA